MFRLKHLLAWLVLGLASLSPATAFAAESGCFAQSLSRDFVSIRLDDTKFLIGWVFDAAAAHKKLAAGDIVTRNSGLSQVPGFGAITSLAWLQGRYRVMRPPFDLGKGYYGVELGSLEPDGRISNIFLINRVFRMPLLFREPAGVAADIATNAAILMGWQTASVSTAEQAAATARDDAERLKIPLFIAGQSQAGGTAQLQVASLIAAHPGREVPVGFITFNAAYVVASIRKLGVPPEQVPGINFSKDLDPGFGPYGLLPNKVGLQVYIHRDATGGPKHGPGGALAAWEHAKQHYLSAFNPVRLSNALGNALKDGASCPA